VFSNKPEIQPQVYHIEGCIFAHNKIALLQGNVKSASEHHAEWVLVSSFHPQLDDLLVKA
jgi:hypothetical protein